MEVPKSFAKQVSALAESTPREAIANLLSALLPKVIAQTRAPTSPSLREVMEQSPTWTDRPDPIRKLTRHRTTRKPMPRGKLVYIKPNPKRGASAIRYNCYELGMTAFQAIRAGVGTGDIQWDLDHGFIRFSEED